ncbi:hypothetical protein [Cupriavidus oxalaticus]|uniref:hypothetical protein n=1 Tax=Cupriavidus oxalaticus TaxID=96344 RepID=UPI004033773E
MINQQVSYYREGNPEVNIDVPAVVSQFLGELSMLDLVIELVQNDLDAGATRTEIVFGPEAITCCGDGSPIDSAGWNRLKYVLGAGSVVVAKREGMGSKNHGLRSAFLLGDQILVQSAGQRIDLTVRGKSSQPDDFFPAVWPPISDPTAPPSGVRITIPYRTRALHVPERNPLEPIDEPVLTSLYNDAVKESADRFLCASAPNRSWRYELALVHGLRRTTFVFSSCPAPRLPRFFLRECKQADHGGRGRVVARRLCTAFDIALAADDHAKVPRLFRRGERIVGEISWNVDGKLAPQSGPGGYRYPIAYPKDHVSIGWGFDVSGPFISARARHSLSDDPRNALIARSGRKAFVDLMARELVPRHGPRALLLTSNPQRIDRTAEDALARELVSAGALPVAVPTRGHVALKRFCRSEPDRSILVAVPTHVKNVLDKDLAKVAAQYGQALHPQTPPPFVEALLRLQVNGDKAIERFSEQDAARMVFGREPDPATFNLWLAHSIVVLRALEMASLASTLPPEFMRSLRSAGVLPTDDGRAAAWSAIRRSLKIPPPVPGVTPPAILHRSLVKAVILKEGAAKIPNFKIDEHVSNLDFRDVISEARNSFFVWLRKNHTELMPKTLSEIAGYPIWPAQDGMFYSLDRYCMPKSAYLRTVLSEIQSPPANTVTTFPGLRSASNASLRLRTKPTEGELTTWHTMRQGLAQAAWSQGNTSELQSIVNRTEDVLEFLSRDGFPVNQIAKSHKTVSLAGELSPISDLHIQGLPSSSCALLPQDITAGHRESLYRQLGATVEPTASAILRAFRAAPNQTAIFNRMKAYRMAGHELSDLSEIAMIEVDSKLYSPSQLCFPSKIDWWGQWKIAMKVTLDVPEHGNLLEKAGVVKSALREPLSQAFFDWLAVQPNSVQRRHRQQILRHWNDRKSGPSKWVRQYPEIKCLAVHDRRGEFSLLSIKQAQSRRSQVYLPDFDEIQAVVLNDCPRMRLAIVEAPHVDGNILDILRAAGVRSLRDFAGQPVRLRTDSEATLDEALQRELALVRSRSTLNSLPKRLPVYDVPNSALRHGWRQFLREIAGVRVAQNLTAIFRVFAREYEISRESGFDLPTRQICVNASSDRKLAFYAALAAHLFEPGSSSLYEYGLMKAVHSRASNTTYDDLRDTFDEEVDIDPAAAQTDDGAVGSGEDGVARKGHGASDAEETPFAPNPAPLKPIGNPTYPDRHKRRQRRRSQSGSTNEMRHSLEEDEHIRDLKQEHYAWHCQACLGERNVLDVTPPRSYIYQPQHRKGLIEAHHVEHLQNNGQIGASNLLILCKFHHLSLGDEISRNAVLQALDSASPIVRHFPLDKNGSQYSEIVGLLADLTMVPGSSDVKLFFTQSHAASWLESR